MKLLIISHTDHYYDVNGNIAGWGPTVREIDAIAELFDSIVHIACLHKDKLAPASAVTYQSEKIKFIGIAPFGGDGLSNKLNIVTSSLHNLRLVQKELQDADMFHFRAPTSIGLYLIPYLNSSGKTGWYKYAGNWMAENTPLSYRMQRNMLLKQQQHKITINGHWPNQPVQCLSFENPCLYYADRTDGAQSLQHKQYNAPFNLCFAGRLDREKGIYQVIAALKHHPDKSIFDQLDVIGDGPEYDRLRNAAKDLGVPVIFHSALPREKLFELYRQSHFLLLPSESEGFPKVVAEAANFGCIPIVSDVSAISQYVNANNGFLWDASKGSFADFFTELKFPRSNSLHTMAMNAHQMANAFTYSQYITKLKNTVLQ